MQSLSTLLTELFFKQTRFTPLTKSFALLQYTPFQHLAIHCGIFVCSTLIVLNWGTVVANLIDSDVDGYAVPDISLTTLAAVAWGGVLVWLWGRSVWYFITFLRAGGAPVGRFAKPHAGAWIWLVIIHTWMGTALPPILVLYMFVQATVLSLMIGFIGWSRDFTMEDARVIGAQAIAFFINVDCIGGLFLLKGWIDDSACCLQIFVSSWLSTAWGLLQFRRFFDLSDLSAADHRLLFLQTVVFGSIAACAAYYHTNLWSVRYWFDAYLTTTLFVCGWLLVRESPLGHLAPDAFLFLVVLATLLKSAVLYQQNSASRALVTEGVVASYYALMWPALLVLPHFLFEVSSGIGEGVLQILALYTVKFILLFSAAVVVYHSYDYVAERRIDTAEYGVLMLLATASLYLLILSTNLLAGFVCIMGFSLNTYTLLATDIHNAGRREASIKYFYLSAVSAGLLIYGIFLVYSIAGTLDYTALNNFFTNSNALNTEYELTTAISGICLILTGLSFKLSAFPGHLWAPEVYEGASNPTAAFFILPAKVGAVLFLFNLVTGPLASAHNVCSTALLIFGVVSVVWGCLAATYEKKIKRFLAYTSINQVGFLLLALVSGTFDSTLLLLFYLATYAAGGAGFMAIFLTARRARGLLNVYLTDFRGYAVTNLLAAIYAAAFLFSMAGMPPFGGFFAKYFLFVELQFAQAYVAVVVGLITSLPSAYYYLRVIKLMLFEVDANLEVPHAPLTRVSYRLMYWPLLFLGAAVVLSPALFDLFASVITNAAGEI